MQNTKLVAVGGLLLLSIIWGSNIPFMKEALDFSSPALFAFLRNFFGPIALFITLIHLGNPIKTTSIPHFFALGLFQTAGIMVFLRSYLVEQGAQKSQIV